MRQEPPERRLIINGRRGFTLVELMVVVVIIAVLMMVAAPIFQGANRGSRIRTSAFQLSTTFTLARQTAITQRKLVHIIFPDHASFLFAGQPREAEKAYRSYAPFASFPGGSSTNGEYIGEWRMLAPGIVFNPDYIPPAGSGIGGNIFLAENPPGKLTLTNTFPFPMNSGIKVGLFCVTFRPDGAMDKVGSTAKAIFLTEGIVEADLVNGAASFPQYRPNSTVTALGINPLTGNVRTRDFTP